MPSKSADWVEPFMDGYTVGFSEQPATVPAQFAAVARHWLAGWDAGKQEADIARIELEAVGAIPVKDQTHG